MMPDVTLWLDDPRMQAALVFLVAYGIGSIPFGLVLTHGKIKRLPSLSFCILTFPLSIGPRAQGAASDGKKEIYYFNLELYR